MAETNPADESNESTEPGAGERYDVGGDGSLQEKPVGPPQDVPGGIPAVDGAVRQLEKAALAADRTTKPAPGQDLGAARGRSGEVVSLGKDGGGAPEDAVADTVEH